MPSTPCLSVLAWVFALAACSSGSGPLGPQRPIERDPPYSSQDSPSASGSCVSCGENFRCTGFSGKVVDVVYASQVDGAECALVGGDARLRCDGAIVTGANGQETTQATWMPGPGGGFITCAAGDCVTCVPTTDPPTPRQPQPQPGGGNGTPDAG